MGLRKYRSVEEMQGPPQLRRLDPDNLRIACGLASLVHALSPIHRTPGVRRFRSWPEAMAAREAEEQQAARATQSLKRRTLPP